MGWGKFCMTRLTGANQVAASAVLSRPAKMPSMCEVFLPVPSPTIPVKVSWVTAVIAKMTASWKTVPWNAPQWERKRFSCKWHQLLNWLIDCVVGWQRQMGWCIRGSHAARLVTCPRVLAAINFWGEAETQMHSTCWLISVNWIPVEERQKRSSWDGARGRPQRNTFLIRRISRQVAGAIFCFVPQ